MKLFALTIVGSAVADIWDPKVNDDRVADTWNGYLTEDLDTACGMTYDDNTTSLVNKTCYISIPEDIPTSFASLYVGNGAFVVGLSGNRKMATVTGLDGASTTMQFNAVFVQEDVEVKDGEKDNDTCWRTEVTCEDDVTFKYMEDALLMESVNSNNGANHYQFQATGHWNGGTMTVQLVDDNGEDLVLSNVSCTNCESATANGNTIVFQLNAEGYNHKSTFSFGANTDKTPNVWKSSIEVA